MLGLCKNVHIYFKSAKMVAQKDGQSVIRMSLLLCLLLLSSSDAFSPSRPEPLGDQPTGCYIIHVCGDISEIDQGSHIECSNITAFSEVTEVLTSADQKVVTLTISKSPQLVLQRADLDNPAFNELKTLYLKSSDYTSFDLTTLQGLAKLEILNIHGTNLHTIAAGTFHGLTNLKGLSLEGNNIVAIEAGAFKDLPNLDLLHLGGNLLTSIPSGLFEGTTCRNLDLKSNQITAIEEGSLTGLDNLINIDLSANKIKSIDSKAFQTLVHLNLVNLGSNQLDGIDSRLFENNPLVGLGLHMNNLENINNFKLNHTSLNAISLRGCNIQSIPVDYFDNLPGLLILDIHGNNITTIPTGLLTPLTNPRLLDLNENKLTSLSVASFSQLEKLVKAAANHETSTFFGQEFPSEIRMRDNPWDCSSSDMTELRAWCDQNQVVFDDLFNCNYTQAPISGAELQEKIPV